MQQTTKQKSRLAQNRQFWQKSWMYPELSDYLSVSKNNLNNLPAFGIDGKTRSPTCKMKSNAWFSHSCANKMTFHILFFALFPSFCTSLFLNRKKPERANVRDLSQSAVAFAFWKACPPDLGEKIWRVFFSVKSGGTLNKILGVIFELAVCDTRPTARKKIKTPSSIRTKRKKDYAAHHWPTRTSWRQSQYPAAQILSDSCTIF